MSQNSSYSSPDAGRMGSVRIARRQLLTARSATDLPPPRVVLHLPDLNALDGVVLGPPKPTSRRRLDGAHSAVPGESHAGRAKQVGTPGGPAEPTLVNLLRAPLKQLAPQLGNGTTLEKLGKLVVLLQQPKVLLATIMAVGLQLAAVLAMLTGNAPSPTNTSSAPVDSSVTTAPEVSLPMHSQTVGHDGPIRTPLSIQPGNGGPLLSPSLPPAQSLPGMAGGNLPSWQAAPAVGSSAPPPAAAALEPPAKDDAPPTSAKGAKPTRAKLVGTITRNNTSGATP